MSTSTLYEYKVYACKHTYISRKKNKQNNPKKQAKQPVGNCDSCNEILSAICPDCATCLS